jgi:hypothetical protein
MQSVPKLSRDPGYARPRALFYDTDCTPFVRGLCKFRILAFGLTKSAFVIGKRIETASSTALGHKYYERWDGPEFGMSPA